MLSASIRALYGMFLRWYPLNRYDSPCRCECFVGFFPLVHLAEVLEILTSMDVPLATWQVLIDLTFIGYVFH
jgi:hypothetical protein